jgi:hypothetical protein
VGNEGSKRASHAPIRPRASTAAFFPLRYAMNANAVHVLSLSEFWTFCKDVDAPTVNLNLTRATLLFTAIDTKYKDDPYNPRRGFNLHEFVEGIVRMSVLRQANPSDPAVPLPECLENFLLHNVLKDTESFHASQQVSAGTRCVSQSSEHCTRGGACYARRDRFGAGTSYPRNSDSRLHWL